ncbi:MAG: acylneuraminate cytidylyltransferase [Anaerolineaceae bacterium]|nr:acylneuraminate cytidylyltransferase [Anaerolineaceae bacterium]
MVDRPVILAVIPARGGSKGILRKNIRDFAGYPLIAYSIAAALRSQSVTRTIVSTDDEEIAEIARSYGAEVPFLRPAEFAQDNTLDLPVFQHALGWLAENQGYRPKVVVQLRPTSPVRPPDLVDRAVNTLLSNLAADSVRGVVPAGQNPYKMWQLDASGQMLPLLQVAGITEPYNAPRQVLPPVFWQTGHIDAIRPAVILEQGSMSGQTVFPVMIDPRYTVDLDNPNDWQRAEWLVRFGGLEMVSPRRAPRPLPEHVDLVVMDFDGVLTDNRVWVGEDGRESIAAYRSDALGIEITREQTGIQFLVISKETNPVVAARCRKMRVPFLQAIDDKPAALRQALAERGVEPACTIFVGNDLNDLPCFESVACAVVPSDAEPEILRRADLVLTRRGGHGAVRELCDMLREGVMHDP